MATPAPAPRINPTRPEHLGPSTKRTSKAALLQQYQQLLPLQPLPPSRLAAIASVFPFGRPALAPPRVPAVWDTLTHTVRVSDDVHMTRLWRQGFFGKGFLSRSEPSWRRRVENRRAQLLSGTASRSLTAEEVTALRRRERKGTKLAKKLERDAERLLAATTATSTAATGPLDPKGKGKGREVDALPAITGAHVPVPNDGDDNDDNEDDDEDEADEQDLPPPAWQLDAEHLQLQPEEAFFLLFALDILSLTVSDPLAPAADTNDPPPSSSSSSPSSLSAPAPGLSLLAAFRLFLHYAAPAMPPSLLEGPDPRLSRLDSPFLLSYAVYHHYRSMGWVVRSGIKFCVDWVLYGQGGPVGGHAEFAVLVLPTYVDPADAASNPFRSHSHLALDRTGGAMGELEHLAGEGERKNSWRWFHTVNRVCSGVKKTLVLAHVVIPPLSSLPPTHSDPEWVARHPAQALARLEVREVVVRRFLAGRMRD